MSSAMSADNILAAFTNLQPALPSLVGKGWEAIEKKFEAQMDWLQHSTNPKERERLASALVDIIAPYDQAQKRVQDEIQLQHMRVVLKDTIDKDLAGLAATLGLHRSVVEQSAELALRSMVAGPAEPGVSEDTLRLIKIKAGGIDGGRTVKFNNLHLDLGELIGLAGEVTMTGSAIVAQPHPIIIVAGVLLIIRALRKAMTVSLSEREASVFWGLIGAQIESFYPDRIAILKHTNAGRAKFGLSALDEDQVTAVLKKLQALKCVKISGQKPETWRIVENYEIEY
jgi:hypothetical protein